MAWRALLASFSARKNTAPAMTTHFPQKLDAVSPVVSPVRGRGEPTRHPEPVGSSDRHLFFDPDHDYLDEMWDKIK